MIRADQKKTGTVQFAHTGVKCGTTEPSDRTCRLTAVPLGPSSFRPAGFDRSFADFASKSSHCDVAALARVRSSGTRVLANAATMRKDPIKALRRSWRNSPTRAMMAADAVSARVARRPVAFHAGNRRRAASCRSHLEARAMIPLVWMLLVAAGAERRRVSCGLISRRATCKAGRWSRGSSTTSSPTGRCSTTNIRTSPATSTTSRAGTICRRSSSSRASPRTTG